LVGAKCLHTGYVIDGQVETRKVLSKTFLSINQIDIIPGLGGIIPKCVDVVIGVRALVPGNKSRIESFLFNLNDLMVAALLNFRQIISEPLTRNQPCGLFKGFN
ncbi:hypothetical protein HHX47_DHR1000615, partial [Lentinula edodes]